MAFPFDLLDVLLPEIAHWMAGKSTSEKQRFRRAGVGLTLLGVLMALACFFLESAMTWAFNTIEWAWFVAFLFFACGVGLLVCLRVDKKMNCDSN